MTKKFHLLLVFIAISFAVNKGYNQSSDSILIFTQEDSDGKKKPYMHEQDAHNISSYF